MIVLISAELESLFMDMPSEEKNTIFLRLELKPCFEKAEIIASLKPGTSWDQSEAAITKSFINRRYILGST